MIERHPDDHTPLPTADELAELRALVHATINETERCAGESESQYRERVEYRCRMLMPRGIDVR